MSKRYAKSSNVTHIYSRSAIKPLNDKQARYINMLKNNTIVVASGAAGTSKTFIPSCMAIDWLDNPGSPIEKIVIIRPPEGPGKTLGYLPGDANEKLRVWAAPILSAIENRLGGGFGAKEQVSNLIKIGKIELISLEHVRGLSLNNAVVILDEAQNCSFEEVKAVLTRIGLDTKLVIAGDILQKDIRGDSGLGVLLRLQKEYVNLPWSNISFGIEDCVRSETVKQLLYLFEDAKV